MFILQILGFIVAGIALYGFIEYFNAYTQKAGKYRFFTLEHTAAFGAAYVLMFIGTLMIRSNWKDDPLNGIIVFAIGAVILILTLRNNFQKSDKKLALQGSIAQLVLYVPITIGGVFVLFMLLAFFAQTKPVFTLNDK
jgi:hypothetical protein